MAKNSIREQLLEYHRKTLIGKVKLIKTVIRTMPKYEDLDNFAATQLPVAAVVGRLPVPVEKVSSRDGSAVDIIISNLKIETIVYFQEKENPDSELSWLLDDVWVKLYSDVTYNSLALGTILEPSEDVVYWEPYVAFKVISNVRYQHTTGGI